MSTTPKCTTLIRRLAAIVYDWMLLFSVLFALTLFVLLPLNQGDAINSGNIVYQLFLLLISYVYFGWQWCHGGQTLGMRAWRIRVQRADQQPLGWFESSMRFVFAMLSIALLGTGFILSLFDENQNTLHDRLSKTALIDI